MSRPLNTATLDNAAREFAGHWFLPTTANRHGTPVAGREWVLDTLYRADFKDEHEYLVNVVERHLGESALIEFREAARERFTPRHDDVFEQLLEEKLAIRPSGEKVKGKIGTVQIGTRVVGMHAVEVETPASLMWRRRMGLDKSHRDVETRVLPKLEPVYAGQEELFGVGAQNMNISAEIALLALDAMLDGLDEGAGAAVIQGRTGAQPADPDAATTGTLLFTLVCSDPAFAAAADQADGTVQAAASAITDDASADATGTLGYCRASATNDGATPLDDHIDGEAGTSGADFNFNTVSIVSGATVSMSSWTVTLDQGTTAT